jgi:2-polyprenyl-3-methyl-5-hydroxy-6-metoxy-1,4-benzoquinol methylase
VGINIEWKKIDNTLRAYPNPEYTFHRTCPICNSTKAKSVWGLNGFQFYTDNSKTDNQVNLNVQQCMNCYALYLNPTYSQIGFKNLFTEPNSLYGIESVGVIEKIEWLKKRDLLKPGLHILDIGCYKGQFLAALPQDVTCTGVDIDQSSINSAQNAYGSLRMEFICADFEKVDMEKHPDLITMFHVLEHFPNPLNVLKRLRSLAKINTKLIIEVPIIENGDTNDINGFFSVQHMTHFSRNSLSNLVALAGWRIKEIQEQADYNGCRIICEPDVPEKKIKWEPHDLSLCYEYLSNWYRTLVDIEKVFNEYQKSNRWIIWGAGLHTEFVYQNTSFFTNSINEREYIIVDSDPLKQGKKWRGISIYNPAILNACTLDEEKILISSYANQPVIEKAVLDLGISPDNIVKLYD